MLSKSVHESFLAKAGRCYGMNNRFDRNRQLKPTDKDGNVVLCRNCNSLWHLIRNCENLKATLLNKVLDLSVNNASNISVTEILDIFEDLPDQVWTVISNSNENHLEYKIAVLRAMYTRLVEIADQHELIGDNIHNRINLNSKRLVKNANLVLTT